MDPAAFINIAAAAADPTRFRMLLQLGGRPLCVGQLAGCVGITSSATTYHVRRLRQAGLVIVQRAGRRTVVRRNERRWAALQAAFADG